MSGLRAKLNDFQKLLDLTMHYEFENGFILEFSFNKKSFPHMIGLHKLIDIPLLYKFNTKKVNANYIISKINNGKLTESDIKSSIFFPKIENRYNNFYSENLFSLSYTDVIIDFDINKLQKSKLKNTRFILFEKDKAKGYRQLCIGKNKMSVYYPETFFYEPSDYYIQNQTIQKIKKIQIIKNDGNIYFEDSFILP